MREAPLGDAEEGMSPDFAECPQSGATRKTYARYEFFSVWTRSGHCKSVGWEPAA
jgi:hypothetical protein